MKELKNLIAGLISLSASCAFAQTHLSNFKQLTFAARTPKPTGRPMASA